MSLLISSSLVVLLLIFAAITFERTRPKPRDLMPVVVLTALAILGRVVMMPIPNFQPATALIILAGFFFGRNAGLLCGMLVAFISNMIMVQGPWTPWQMLAWGLVGYGAGILGDMFSNTSRTPCQPEAHTPCHPEAKPKDPTRLRQIITIIYGIVTSMLFGMIMDLQFFIAYAWETGWSGLIATWAMGFSMNVAHAVSTLVFLILVLVPWGKKLQRLKTKYGIQSI